jgi:murein L,D-transpeptidase YafK
LSRPVVRALLASAAVAAAIALAGCNADDIAPNGRAQAPLSPRTVALISEKNMDSQSPILVRIFKEEAELELWKVDRGGQYALLKTYPICKWSGDLGPKKKEGDRQAPEGFYTITPAQMNPNSNYYLAFNTGFPNAYDRAHNYTGSELMVHGDCSSRGCYAMTDEQIQEIYALARESFFGGQSSFQFEAFPFHMTALNMAKHRNNPNFAFWKMLKEGYDNFEATRQEPKVAVCEKRYVFDGTSEDGKAIRSNPSGACPAHRLDPAIASTVLDYRQKEQVKMASYINARVATATPHQGDGGTNPVFMAQLATGADSSGRYMLASVAPDLGSHVPGALPHVPNPPGTTIPKVGAAKAAPAPAAEPAGEPAPASAPVVMASVRLPTPAPQPKEGQAPEETPKPANFASLFGNMFNNNSSPTPPPPAAQAPPAAEPTEQVAQVALRGTNTEMAAKPMRAEKTRVAAAPVSLQPQPQSKSRAKAQPAPEPKPQRVAAQPKQDSIWDQAKPAQLPAQPPAQRPEQRTEPAKPAAVAKAEPPAKPPQVKVATAAKTPSPAPAREPEIRTAYSGTTTGSGGGLLAGAQPVVPAGSFNSFR